MASGWGREQLRPHDAGHEAGWEPTGALEDSAQTGIQRTEDLLPPPIPTEKGREAVLLLCLLALVKQLHPLLTRAQQRTQKPNW